MTTPGWMTATTTTITPTTTTTTSTTVTAVDSSTVHDRMTFNGNCLPCSNSKLFISVIPCTKRTRYTISGVIFSTIIGPHPTDYRTKWTPVWFKTVIINDEDALSGGGNETIGVPHSFTSPGKDVYLFSLVGVSHTNPYYLRMTGVNPSMGITHSTGWDHWETLSRNVMLYVDKGQVIQLQYKGYAAYGVGSSWGRFLCIWLHGSSGGLQCGQIYIHDVTRFGHIRH